MKLPGYLADIRIMRAALIALPNDVVMSEGGSSEGPGSREGTLGAGLLISRDAPMRTTMATRRIAAFRADIFTSTSGVERAHDRRSLPFSVVGWLPQQQPRVPLVQALGSHLRGCHGDCVFALELR